MNWLKFFKYFLRNLILLTGVSTLLLGGFGYFLAGKEGFINMAIWGFAFGLIGSFSSGLGAILQAYYWGKGNFDKLGEWNWFIKKSPSEQKKDY